MSAELKMLNCSENENKSVHSLSILSRVYSKLTLWCRGPDLNQRQLGLQLHPQQTVVKSSALPI
jgi:hypothetical protein